MSERLPLPDHRSATDLQTFASRAARVGDGAVRLRAADGVLVVSAAPLAPRGLLDATPTVLGLRVMAVDPELECDLVVDGARLVVAPDDAQAIVLPESALSVAWAGVSPPRGGWEETGALSSAALASVADRGIAEVAQALPVDPGEEIVRDVRARVWGMPESALEDLPAGAAFAAVSLGFLGEEETVAIRRSGGWVRLSFGRGHVLVRGPRVSGLSPVRRTGAQTA